MSATRKRFRDDEHQDTDAMEATLINGKHAGSVFAIDRTNSHATKRQKVVATGAREAALTPPLEYDSSSPLEDNEDAPGRLDVVPTSISASTAVTKNKMLHNHHLPTPTAPLSPPRPIERPLPYISNLHHLKASSSLNAFSARVQPPVSKPASHSPPRIIRKTPKQPLRDITDSEDGDGDDDEDEYFDGFEEEDEDGYKFGGANEDEDDSGGEGENEAGGAKSDSDPEHETQSTTPHSQAHTPDLNAYPINSFLHELHFSRRSQRPLARPKPTSPLAQVSYPTSSSSKPSTSSSSTSLAQTKSTIPQTASIASEAARAAATRRAQLAAEKEREGSIAARVNVPTTAESSSASSHDDKDVGAKYEETNRLLGALFLSRRRQQTGNSSICDEDEEL